MKEKKTLFHSTTLQKISSKNFTNTQEFYFTTNMSSTQRVTRSMPKDPGTSSSMSANKPTTKQTNNTEKTGKQTQAKPSTNTASMEIEFQTTEPGIETMEIHFEQPSPFGFEKPPSPFGFGGE